MKNKRTPLNSFIIAVIAILLTILIAGPFVFMILTTFKQIGEVMRFPPKLLPDSFYLQNYVKSSAFLYSKSFPEQSFCKCNVCYRYLTVISAGSVRLFQT